MRPLFSDNNGIGKHFRDELEHHKVNPPARVWEKVAAHQKHSLFRRKLKRGLGLLLMLTGLSITVWLVIKQEKTNEKFNEFHVQSLADKVESLVPIFSSNESKVSDISLKQSSGQRVKLFEIIRTQKIFVDQNYLPIIKENHDINFIVFTRPNYFPVLNDGDFINNSIQNNPEFTQEIRNSIMPLKGWYAGVTANVYASYLLDKASMDNPAFHYDLHVGKSLGIQGGYNFSNSFGCQAGLNVYASAGQDYFYKPYSTARTFYEHRNLNLKYIQAPFELKYMMTKMSVSGKTQSLNLTGGVQVAYLTTSSLTINDEKVGMPMQIKRNDVALLAGFDFNFYSLHNNFTSIGIQTSLGKNILKNSVKNEWQEFNEPHNFTIGVHAAYNFSLN